MKVKPTFFNTRTDRLHWDYVDTNSVLFIILFDSGAEMSFIFRNLKKDDNVLTYISKKLHKRFDNIIEIETNRLSNVEYNLLKQKNMPSILKIC
tara:strand:- start:825 stop:1106 length:282 start_codon:yes stop_codon:yes gene_type:complete